jgi:hypothetical protein
MLVCLASRGWVVSASCEKAALGLGRSRRNVLYQIGEGQGSLGRGG